MKRKFVVMLDALLDTRLGTMFGIDKEAATKLLVPMYHGRLRDNFTDFQDKVSHETYAEAYKNRNKDTLKGSLMTMMNIFLGELVRQTEKLQRENQATVDDIEVLINCYPYQLTENEHRAIAVAVASRTGIYTPVNTIHVPVEQMTIGWLLQEDVSHLIIYDFAEWAIAVLGQLDTHPENAPGVKLYTAALLDPTQDEPDEEMLKDKHGNMMDPFQEQARFFSEVIGLEFLPAEMFSIPTPKEIFE